MYWQQQHHPRQHHRQCHGVTITTLLLGFFCLSIDHDCFSDGFVSPPCFHSKTFTTRISRNLPTWKSLASSSSDQEEVVSESSSEQQKQKIEILYDSDRILIINKPIGIQHHNDNNSKNEEGHDDDDKPENLGIVNLIRQAYASIAPETRLWGVHRLDRVTSGILVFAKDCEMASCLTNAFASGEIQKVYMGISAKKPKQKKQGWVQGNMERGRNKSWKLVNSKSKKNNQQESKTDGKSNYARTRFFTARWRGKYTVILFRPYTGKTHQLRVAAKAMGIALLGDPTYSDGLAVSEATDDDQERTYLHASGICIPSLDGHDSVSIWCHPPFEESLFTPDDGNNDEPLNNIIIGLMNKNCDVSSINEMMMTTIR